MLARQTKTGSAGATVFHWDTMNHQVLRNVC